MILFLHLFAYPKLVIVTHKFPHCPCQPSFFNRTKQKKNIKIQNTKQQKNIIQITLQPNKKTFSNHVYIQWCTPRISSSLNRISSRHLNSSEGSSTRTGVTKYHSCDMMCASQMKPVRSVHDYYTFNMGNMGFAEIY